MDTEAGVMPGKDFACDLGAYEIPGYQECEHLMGEETGDGGIIEDRHGVEITIA